MEKTKELKLAQEMEPVQLVNEVKALCEDRMDAKTPGGIPLDIAFAVLTSKVTPKEKK